MDSPCLSFLFPVIRELWSPGYSNDFGGTMDESIPAPRAEADVTFKVLREQQWPKALTPCAQILVSRNAFSVLCKFGGKYTLRYALLACGCDDL